MNSNPTFFNFNTISLFMQTEALIQQIFDTADELRVLAGIKAEETTQVRVDRWQTQWHVTVSPSFLTFGDRFTHIMERGHSGRTLKVALDKALEGAKEELALFKEGKTVGVK